MSQHPGVLASATRKPSRKARWLLFQGGGFVCGILLFITIPAVWVTQGWISGLVALVLWVNVAIAFWGQQSAYRLGYWRGRGDAYGEHIARELGVPWPFREHADPWAPRPDESALFKAYMTARANGNQ